MIIEIIGIWFTYWIGILFERIQNLMFVIIIELIGILMTQWILIEYILILFVDTLNLKLNF